MSHAFCCCRFCKSRLRFRRRRLRGIACGCSIHLAFLSVIHVDGAGCFAYAGLCMVTLWKFGQGLVFASSSYFDEITQLKMLWFLPALFVLLIKLRRSLPIRKLLGVFIAACALCHVTISSLAKGFIMCRGIADCDVRFSSGTDDAKAYWMGKCWPLEICGVGCLYRVLCDCFLSIRITSIWG